MALEGLMVLDARKFIPSVCPERYLALTLVTLGSTNL